jgi:hypothetical protein
MVSTVDFGRALTSHGRGRWFDPSIAHFRRAAAAKGRAPECSWDFCGATVQLRR